MVTTSAATAALAQVTAGLAVHEDRPGQQQMAAAVADAIESGRHLVVQAGTGTGKTLAYLVPAILSGKRTAVAAPWNKGKDATLELRREPVADSGLVAQVEPGAVGEISRCNGSWCEVSFDGYRGWMSQTLLWGAYPDEQIDK